MDTGADGPAWWHSARRLTALVDTSGAEDLPEPNRADQQKHRAEPAEKGFRLGPEHARMKLQPDDMAYVQLSNPS
ncbi:hypothetical protein GCM10022278_27620 [Allohahella marinimesophila]|uniref:Uncharacterized protein n=1 Tax=Allohahella marinimesophila TaxID=1054972 RepID=A0ABP7PNT2_9GAMM